MEWHKEMRRIAKIAQEWQERPPTPEDLDVAPHLARSVGRR